MIDVKICGLSPTTQAALIEVFRAFPSVIQVKLFGSRAMGRYREGSDIDLVAIHEIDNPALLEHINRVGIDFL